MKKKLVVVLLILIVAIVAVAVIGVVLHNKTATATSAIETSIQDRITSEIVDGDDLPAETEYANAVYSAIEFDVKSVSTQNESASVEFSYPDIFELSKKYDVDSQNPEQFYAQCAKSIVEGSAKTNTETITLSYSIDENGTAIIEDSPELANVLTGGAYNMIMELTSND